MGKDYRITQGASSSAILQFIKATDMLGWTIMLWDIHS